MTTKPADSESGSIKADTKAEFVVLSDLLDALCVLHSGWNDENEAIYRDAQKLVWTHAQKLKLKRQLQDLTGVTYV